VYQTIGIVARMSSNPFDSDKTDDDQPPPGMPIAIDVNGPTCP
jgi:hypothetical protein